MKLATKERFSNPKGITVLGEDPNFLQISISTQEKNSFLNVVGYIIALGKDVQQNLGDIISSILETD